jgi:hypothetical protein
MGVDATEAFLAADATRRVQERGSDHDDGDSTGSTSAGRKPAGRGTTPLRLVSGE